MRVRSESLVCRRAGRKRRPSRIIGFLARTALVAAATGSLAAPALGQGLFGLSPEQEKEVGTREHARVLEQFGGAYDNPALGAYIDSIGQFLSRTSSAPDVGYRFTVLNSPVVNAFALPGGFVYVTRGLVALASDEAELAGVIAHEIAHIAARHGSNRQSKGTIASLGIALLGVVTGSSAAVDLAQFGAAAMLSAYSREDEHEADQLGIEYLARAGFDAGAMARFLEKMQASSDLEAAIGGQRGGGGLDFFSSHPRTGDRVERAYAAARRVASRDPIVARDIFLGKLDGMLFGDDPAQGMVLGRRFVHPVLRFEFTVPEGFAVHNGAQSVVARKGEEAIIQFDLATRPVGLDPAGYMRNVWAKDAALEDHQRIRINGLEAATARVRGQSGNTTVDYRLVAIAFSRDRVARFVFATPGGVGARYDTAFRETAWSYRWLSDAEAARVRPTRIAIHAVRPGETLERLASHRALGEHAVRRLRVLNGLPPGGHLIPGERVKLVVE